MLISTCMVSIYDLNSTWIVQSMRKFAPKKRVLRMF